MNLLTKDYFIRNWRLTTLGAICGVALAALFGLCPRSVSFLFAWLAVMPFVNCPFTLRTQAGRVWWGAYACLYACLVVIHLVRLPHLLAWAGLMISGGCGILTVCLRWNPPSGGMLQGK